MTVQPPPELAGGDDNAEALEAMRRAVERSVGYHLYAVRCPENAPERAVARYLLGLGEASGRPLVHRDVRRSDDPLSELDSGTGLVLTGLGAHLARSADVAVALNLERNNLPRRIHGPLFVVMPATLMGTLMVWAPDLWSTVTAAWDIEGRAPAGLEHVAAPLPASSELVRLRALLAAAEERDLEPAIRASLAEYAAREAHRCHLYDEAAALAGLAVDGYRAVGDAAAQARASLTWAEALRFRGHLLAAERVVRDAIALRPQSDDARRASLTRELGEVLFRQGRNDDALAAVRAAEESFVRVGDAQGQAHTLLNIGQVLFRQGRNDDALDAFRRADEVYARVGDELGQANASLGIGDVVLRQGHYGAAIEAFVRADEGYERVGDEFSRANASLSLATALFSQGRTGDALDAFRRADEVYTRLGDELGQANVSWLTGEVLTRQGSFDAALHMFWQSHGSYARLGDELGQANAMRGVGDVLVRLRRFDEALDAFGSAGDGFALTGDGLGLANVWRGIGELLYDQRRNDEALTAFRKAGEGYTLVGAVLAHADAWRRIGEVESSESRFDDAISSFRRADEVYASVGWDPGRALVDTAMSEVAEARGDHLEALRLMVDAACRERGCEAWHEWCVSIRRQAALLERLGRAEEAVALRKTSADELEARGLPELAQTLRS